MQTPSLSKFVSDHQQLTSSEHFWTPIDPPITPTGTEISNQHVSTQSYLRHLPSTLNVPPFSGTTLLREQPDVHYLKHLVVCQAGPLLTYVKQTLFQPQILDKKAMSTTETGKRQQHPHTTLHLNSWNRQLFSANVIWRKQHKSNTCLQTLHIRLVF